MATKSPKLLDPILADPARAERVATGVEETRQEIAAYRLAELRRSLGLTQTELAELIGRTQSNVSLLESGGIGISLELLQRIADALGAQLEINMVFNTDQRRVPLAL